MLRRLLVNEKWRSLGPDFWGKQAHFGKQTIIYGHNGSGKSTVAELFLALSEREADASALECPERLSWEDENKNKVSINEKKPLPQNISVFTRKWVESNLRQFLDGDSAEAVVTLDKAAGDALEKEHELAKELSDLAANLKNQRDLLNNAETKLKDLVRDIQEDIVSEFQEIDSSYSRHKYNVNRIEKDLGNFSGDEAPLEPHGRLVAKLQEPRLQSLQFPKLSSTRTEQSANDIHRILMETPDRVALTELEGHSKAQSWVESGLELHEAGAECLFCQGTVTSARWKALTKHFDDSWQKIRQDAQQQHELVSEEISNLSRWLEGLPTRDRLTVDQREHFVDALERLKLEIETRILALESIAAALKMKQSNPSQEIDLEDELASIPGLNTSDLQGIFEAHNKEVQDHEELAQGWKAQLLKHIYAKHFETYRHQADLRDTYESEVERLETAISRVRAELTTVQSRRFTTHEVAKQLTNDLARVFGKNHLRIEMAEDGKAYKCYRGALPATNLSEGEQMTLALLYFFRKLRAECSREKTADGALNRIVVVDDPSSSLDRESLFLTHAFLLDNLARFEQWLVLTHDFELLKLFLKSHKNKISDSKKKIREGDTREESFPKVSCLELRAATIDGQRETKCFRLSDHLTNDGSEYKYLFDIVVRAADGPVDNPYLPLMPNAVRRLLEIFLGFKRPQILQFLNQLDNVIKSDRDRFGEFRALYDFMNRYSHGNPDEDSATLDFVSIHRTINLALDFMKKIDQTHYKFMCKAVGYVETSNEDSSQTALAE